MSCVCSAPGTEVLATWQVLNVGDLSTSLLASLLVNSFLFCRIAYATCSCSDVRFFRDIPETLRRD